jgi:aspartate aminotransferase-like enzyme
MTGEAMLALWGALKSVVKPKDRVFSISTGIFGTGVAAMARDIGAQVEEYNYSYDSIIENEERIEEVVRVFKPKLITAIHCDTPSGTLNPLEKLGKIAHDHGALYYVDFIASGIGVPISIAKSYIDLGLLGTQKCLSLPPDLTIIFVSEKAWKVIDDVSYVGYDALKPWKNSVQQKLFPYAHNWRAVAALNKALVTLKKEGYDNVYKRHNETARYCRNRIKSMGLQIYPKQESYSSPTVTAIYMPPGWTWEELKAKLKTKKIYIGGNYGSLAGKVFRIGHMGEQAHIEYLKPALDELEKLLKQKKSSSKL